MEILSKKYKKKELSISESLKRILEVEKGEYIMDPDYGLDPKDILFINMNPFIQTQIVQQIHKYEKRVKIKSTHMKKTDKGYILKIITKKNTKIDIQL